YTVTLTVTDVASDVSPPATTSFVVRTDTAPVARLTLSQLATPALTVKADASTSTDTDFAPIASYHFTFGDGTAAVTTTAPTATAQHTYAAAGTYTVSLVATDSGGNASAAASASVVVNPPAAGTVTVEKRVVTSTDDAEEHSDLSMHLSSGDLELIHDSSDQTVGIRWTALAIPPGATIAAAYIQFGAKESQSDVTSLAIRAQAADSVATFGSSNGNVSTRPRTTASVAWSPVPWTAGALGIDQRTPDLSPVIQEIVSRPGWASGSSLAIIITGIGHRTAWAYDGNPSQAPLLHVEYVLAGAPTAQLAVTPLASPPYTARADGSASTATGGKTVASYRFDFGDGTAAVTTTSPTTTAQHTYGGPGTYTV